MSDWLNQDKDHFSEHIRNKVYDHGDVPSDGLWDKLEQQLDKEPARRRAIAWWIPVAAALLIGAGAWWLLQDSGTVAGADTPLAQQQPAAPGSAPAPSASSSPSGASPAAAPQAPEPAPTAANSQPQHVSQPADKPVMAQTATAAGSSPAQNAVPRPSRRHHSLAPLPVLAEGRSPATSATDSKPEITQTGAVSTAVSSPAPLPVGYEPVAGATPVLSYVTIAEAEPRPLFLLPSASLPVPSPCTFPLPVAAPEPGLTVKPPPPVSVFSIAIVTNVGSTAMQYAAGTSVADNTRLYKNMAKGRMTYSGGFSAGIGITERLQFSAGFRIGQFSQKFRYGIVPGRPDPSIGPGVPTLTRGYSNPFDSIVTGSGHSHINTYVFTEFPLMLTYHMPIGHSGKWSVMVEGGMSFFRITTANGAFMDADRVGFWVFQQPQDYPAFRNFSTFNAGAGIGYRASENLSIEVTPSVRTATGSMIADKSWVQQTPTLWGCNMTLRRHF